MASFNLLNIEEVMKGNIALKNQNTWFFTTIYAYCI